MRTHYLIIGCWLLTSLASADEKSIPLWPNEIPGPKDEAEGPETDLPGTNQPPIRRTTNITKPSLVPFVPEKPNGVAVIVIPGGGFGYLTTDLEGSEACEW